MNTDPTILVCGVAGVGKTSLIERVLHQLPSAVTWRASEIIGQARKVMDPETLRALPSDEIMRSQQLLIRGYQERRRAFPDTLVLFDAHSVIDGDAGLIDVPLNVILHFRPSCVIHVHDEAATILERRITDLKRKRPARSLDQLAEYQQRSLAACKDYSAALHVSFFAVRAGDLDAFVKAIRDHEPQ